MTSKIERAFEKTNNIFHQNRAKKGHILGIYKDHQCKIPNMRGKKPHFFVRMNCYILLITSLILANFLIVLK